MPHGPDSIETTFLDYLEQNRLAIEAQQEAARVAEQFPGEDTGVGVPEITPPGEEGAPVGTYGPQASVPPLPTNLEELKNFTGWNDPGFLESLSARFPSVPKSGTIDTLLKVGDAPANAVYNYLQNVIPASTEGGAATRETFAKLAYLGTLIATPVVPGVGLLAKGVKALNRASKVAKVEGKVAGRAAEIAAGARPAPVEVLPGVNLTPEASKVARDVVAGLPADTSAAITEALPALKPGEIKLGRNAVGEGERGFFSRTGEDIAASPEGHQFTDAPNGSLRYRLLETPDRSRAFFDIPPVVSPQQFSLILRRSRGMDEIILDLPTHPTKVSTLRELREAVSPFVEKESFELAPLISKTHAEFGGSTFSLTGQNLANTEGYAVGRFKNLEKVLDHAPSEAEVKTYIDGLPDALTEQLKTKRGNFPTLNIGTWEDGGKHYLDVSQVVPNYDRAMTVAVENGQKAIFDLKKMESISVEAQGFVKDANALAPGPGQSALETGLPVPESVVKAAQLPNTVKLPELGEAESVGAAASKLGPGGTVQMNRALERSAESMPSLQKAVDFFHEGAFNRDWYKGAFDELKTHFGDKADQMARLVAATSPRNDPKDNLNIALKVFNQVAGKDTSKWTTAKWTKVASEAGVIYPSQFAGNIRRAVHGEDLSGLKVQNFYKAITGDPNAVVVDAWVSRFYLGPERRPGSPGSGFGVNEAEYALIRGRIVSGANALGVPPAEFQAAIWSAQKMTHDPQVVAKLDKGVPPAEVMPHLAEIIKRGMVEAEKKNLLSPKATAAMRTTMGLAVAISMGLLPEGTK